MRKLTAYLLIFACTCLCSAAWADDGTRLSLSPPAAKTKPGKLHLKPHLKWHFWGHLAAMPAYFLTYTLVHEGSHCLAAKAAGADIEGYRPYPHLITGPDGKQHFVWGDMSYKYKIGSISDRQNALIAAAPYFTDFTLFTASDLTLTYGLSPDSRAGPPILAAGMLAPLIHWMINFNGFGDGNDWSQVSRLSGTPRWMWALIGDAMAGVAIWRVLHHARRIFFTRDPVVEMKEPRLTVLPTLGPGNYGLALGGRF